MDNLLVKRMAPGIIRVPPVLCILHDWNARMKRLVLLGGGHSHVEVVRRFGAAPLADTDILLVSAERESVYSGMLPGFVAGHYAFSDCNSSRCAGPPASNSCAQALWAWTPPPAAFAAATALCSTTTSFL
jgi:hypothetical protein